MKKIYSILPLLILIFVVACTHDSSVRSTTDLPIVLFTTTATVAATKTPTREIIPTLTSTATPPPTKTSTHEIIPTATSTIRPPDQILSSPNGKYIAEFDNAFSHPAIAPQVIRILDQNDLILWEISYQHEIAITDPHPGLCIYGWSQDSTYLYFYYYFNPDGGDRAVWWDGFDLQRINIQTGNIEQVIPGERKGFVAFAFSPDETQIAYTRAQDNPFELRILNLSDGSQKSVTIQKEAIEYKRVGNIIWSPSGADLAFQTEDQNYWVETFYLDVTKMQPRMIWEYDMFTFIAFEGWEDDGTLRFFDYFEDDVYTINVRDLSKSSLGTPTPQP